MCGSTAVLVAQPRVQAIYADEFTAAELKKINAAERSFENNHLEKAILKLDEVQQTHLLSEQLWRRRVDYEYKRYRSYYYSVVPGNKKSADNLVRYRDEAIRQFMFATLYGNEQEKASLHLYTILGAHYDDTMKSDSAQYYLVTGQMDMLYGKYDLAREKFERAYTHDSTWYGTCNDLGLISAIEGNHREAAEWYLRAAHLRPDLWQQWDLLANEYIITRQWEAALDACIEGIIAYPSQGFNIKLAFICEKQGKEFTSHWMARWNMPNQVTVTQDKISDAPWSYYRAKKAEVLPQCNGYGVLDAAAGNERFLEYASWSYMLDQANDHPEFKFANEMREKGYLDCYVFVSLFHFSFYDQYKLFAAENPHRIRTYIRQFVVGSPE